MTKATSPFDICTYDPEEMPDQRRGNWRPFVGFPPMGRQARIAIARVMDEMVVGEAVKVTCTAGYTYLVRRRVPAGSDPAGHLGLCVVRRLPV